MRSTAHQISDHDLTAEQKVRLYAIATKMIAAGLPASFVSDAVELASGSEGCVEMIELWDRFESSPADREQVVADLQDALDASSTIGAKPERRPKVDYKDLGQIAARVTAFKQELRRKVDKWGGISKLAQATGLPQPSLSRFFASASMPRRTTLYRIANALGLDESEIVFDWTT